MFDARPYSWFNFRVDIAIFPFGGIYMVIKLVPPDLKMIPYNIYLHFMETLDKN